MNPIDPRRPGVIDPVTLAGLLAGMDDVGLRQAQDAFGLAADGWQVRVAGGDFVQFSNATRVIPALIARIIARYRAKGTALLPQLEALAADVEDALSRGDQLTELEALWAL